MQSSLSSLQNMQLLLVSRSFRSPLFLVLVCTLAAIFVRYVGTVRSLGWWKPSSGIPKMRTWYQKLSSGLMLLTLMTTHFFQLGCIGTQVGYIDVLQDPRSPSLVGLHHR